MLQYQRKELLLSSQETNYLYNTRRRNTQLHKTEVYLDKIIEKNKKPVVENKKKVVLKQCDGFWTDTGF